MSNLVAVVGLEDLLSYIDLPTGHAENFELLYGSLASKHPDLASEFEQRIRSYFSKLQLPDHATIYDLLVLTLRPKDLIATFNWDPLLLQAFARNQDVGPLPKVAFLHGGVQLGICAEHRFKGLVSNRCPICDKGLAQAPFLLPIQEKKYDAHPLLAAEWAGLSKILKHAYLLTIFGYAAPTSDLAAREMMLTAWTGNPTRSLAEIEVVDVVPRQALCTRWNDFIVSHHWVRWKRFSQTFQARYPRRSCEAFAFASLQQDPWSQRPVPKFRRLDHLQDWIRPLMEEEEELESSGTPLTTFRGAG